VIRDGKVGSGINMLDPQHWFPVIDLETRIQDQEMGEYVPGTVAKYIKWKLKKPPKMCSVFGYLLLDLIMFLYDCF
jgi:hypothetical protein